GVLFGSSCYEGSWGVDEFGNGKGDVYGVGEERGDRDSGVDISGLGSLPRREKGKRKGKSELEILVRGALGAPLPPLPSPAASEPIPESEPVPEQAGGLGLAPPQFFSLSSSETNENPNRASPTPPYPSFQATDPISLQTTTLLQTTLQLLDTHGSDITYQSIHLACQETLHHALAWRYLLFTFVHRQGGEELSEEMVRNTHSILMNGLLPPSALPSGTSSGSTSSEGEGEDEGFAGDGSPPTSSTERESGRNKEMSSLISDFNTHVSSSSKKRQIDPISLAAEFGYRIASIRPFEGGNGRLARLFVNAILLRFLGVVAVFEERDRDEVLGIMARGGEERREKEGEEGKKEKPWGELATFLLGKSVSIVEAVWGVLGDEDIVGAVVDEKEGDGWESALLEMYEMYDESEGEEESDWEGEILGCYFDPGVGFEEERWKRVRWPDPPPKKQYPYKDVLGIIAVPEWVSGSYVERGGDVEDEGFAIFQRKAASLMTGRGFVVPKVVETGPKLGSGEV
ncbi:hypothetical protein IFR05_016105, partial [Cadophora sp. M221]